VAYRTARKAIAAVAYAATYHTRWFWRGVIK
jgi:hypothetical protein